MNASPAVGFKKLVKLRDWAKREGFTDGQAYRAVSQMPNGVRVRIGKRFFVNMDKLNEWIEQGGNVPEGA